MITCPKGETVEMTKKELKEIIERHGKWVLGKKDGVFADLSGVDLSGVNLRGADLSGADLSGANLKGADLSEAYLSCADISGADLSGADLSCADIRFANLKKANLSGAYLNCADIRWANLKKANLKGANLKNADLRYTNIKGTDLRCADLIGTSLSGYMYQITGFGTNKGITTYDVLNNQVICGCWEYDDGNTLENFEKMIENVYGENGSNPNKKYYQKYVGAVKFFRAMKKLED